MLGIAHILGMDDIKPPKSSTNNNRVYSRGFRYIRSLNGRINLQKNGANLPWNRIVYVPALLLMGLSLVLPLLDLHLQKSRYNLSTEALKLTGTTNKSYADKLSFDNKEEAYIFNQDYQSIGNGIGAGGPRIKAILYNDPKKGVSITDPESQVSMSTAPTFTVMKGMKSEGKIIYPLESQRAQLVYTPEANGVKEDIILPAYAGDDVSFTYKLNLTNGIEARLETNGSIGVYSGDPSLYGDISYGSDQDKALVENAQNKSAKTSLIFTIPAPIIKEHNDHQSDAQAKFELKGNLLTVKASHLKSAIYPLSIDPTVTAVSANDFFRDANNDTNVDFDASNNLIKRGILTGGNVASWSSTSNGTLGTARFLSGTATYNGYVYVAGGCAANSSVALSSVEFAPLATGSPYNTGTWTTTASMVTARTRFGLVVYNGYLYAIGGSSNADTATSPTYYSSIERARILPDGSLASWSAATGVMTATRHDFGSVAYNGYIYVSGGKTTIGTGTTTVEYCQIQPSGDVANCATTLALPSNNYGHTMLAYNNKLYVVSGTSTSVLYVSLKSDGSIQDSSWKATTPLGTIRFNYGSTVATIMNGYMYVTGGCNAVNGSASCTTIFNNTLVSQINADGSLGKWFTNSGGTTLSRVGAGVVSWRGVIYSIAGCTAMNAGGVSCQTGAPTLNTQQYAAVVGVGQVSAVGAATSLPTALYGHATVAINGFLYVLGGCNTVSCNGPRVTNYQTSWATINSDGTLSSWTTNSTATDAHALHFDGEQHGFTVAANCSSGLSDQCGLAGMNAVAYNGYIYVLGGWDGSAWNNDIYYQKPNSDGTINVWTHDSDTLLNAGGQSAVFANGGFLYIIGGCNAASPSNLGCSTYFQTVARSQIGASGNPGAWSTTNQLQLPAVNSQGKAIFGAAFYAGYIYLCGGSDAGAASGGDPGGGAQRRTVYYAKVDSSNNIVAVSGGAWQQTTSSMVKERRRTAAVAVNGYLYVMSGHSNDDDEDDATTDAEGTADDATYTTTEVAKIDPGTGNITTGFSLVSSNITGRWNAAATFADGYIFLTGGCTTGGPPGSCSAIGTTNEVMQVYNADNLGGVGSWSSPTAYGTNRLGHGAVAYNGYLYIVGGCTAYTVASENCSTATANTSYAPLNNDGTIGTWTNNTSGGTILPAARTFGALVAMNGYLYYLGGQASGGAAQNSMYYSQIGAAGAIGSWSTGTNLSVNLGWQGAAVYNNRVYMTGGSTGSNVTTTYYSPSLPSGGNIASWSTTTAAFTTARHEHSTVVIGNNLYVIGGYDGSSWYSDVQVGSIGSNGDITSWSFTAGIPDTLGLMGAIAANGYIYVFGGRNGGGAGNCSADTYYAPANSNGTLGEWQQTTTAFTTARQASAAAYYNGYIYVTGGDDCTSVISSNIIQQTGQQSPTMGAVYSRYVDFGGDATPQKLLLTGTNAIVSSVDVDKWKLTYQSSRSATNSWGVATDINPITFDSLITAPAAIDGSSVNQGAAQYWLLTFRIDMAASFLFTDESQPTITGYVFNYSPAPGKRLRNGRDFRDFTKQSLDSRP